MRRSGTLFCAGLLLAAGILLWERIQATRLGYEVGRREIELRRQRGRIAYLQLDAERLLSPERLAVVARERLGMAPPGPEQVMFLDNSVAREMPAPQPEKPAVDVKLALAR
jgi:cell division protein FtsL